MSDYADQLNALTFLARTMDYCETKVSLLEQAVRLADTHGDLEGAFDARDLLIDAACFAGRPDLMLVAFSWCLAQCDREPERFSEERLLWKYKWVVGNVAYFPEVNRAQIDELFADMERRYRKAGSTLHAIHTQRRDAALDMGDLVAAERAQAIVERTSRDHLSDCLACDESAVVNYFTLRGEDEEAVRRAEAMLQRGLRCTEEPHRLHAKLLWPLFRLGRVEEAFAHQRKGYRLISRNPNLTHHVGQHIAFLTQTDNLPQAVRLLERHLQAGIALVSPFKRFHFFRAARFLLKQKAARDQSPSRLRLPTDFPLYKRRGPYDLDALAAWFTGQMEDLAARFDARNGNDHFRRQVEDLDELMSMVKPCPMPS